MVLGVSVGDASLRGSVFPLQSDTLALKGWVLKVLACSVDPDGGGFGTVAHTGLCKEKGRRLLPSHEDDYLHGRKGTHLRGRGELWFCVQGTCAACTVTPVTLWCQGQSQLGA